MNKLIKCPECHGLGYVWPKDWVDCMKCHGTGKITKPKEVKPTKLFKIDSKHAVGPSELSKPTKKRIEKKCNHKWQIIDTNHIFNGGGSSTGLLAVCTKCLEKRRI